MNALDTLLLVVFPYVAVIVFFAGTVYRYRQKGFTVSSLSSQFLEGSSLFWGTILFHIGILGLFLGHLAALLIPEAILAWNSQPLRLVALEAGPESVRVPVIRYVTARCPTPGFGSTTGTHA